MRVSRRLFLSNPGNFHMSPTPKARGFLGLPGLSTHVKTGEVQAPKWTSKLATCNPAEKGHKT